MLKEPEERGNTPPQGAVEKVLRSREWVSRRGQTYMSDCVSARLLMRTLSMLSPPVGVPAPDIRSICELRVWGGHAGPPLQKAQTLIHQGFFNRPLKGGVITDWRGGFVGTGRDLSLQMRFSFVRHSSGGQSRSGRSIRRNTPPRGCPALRGYPSSGQVATCPYKTTAPPALQAFLSYSLDLSFSWRAIAQLMSRSSISG